MEHARRQRGREVQGEYWFGAGASDALHGEELGEPEGERKGMIWFYLRDREVGSVRLIEIGVEIDGGAGRIKRTSPPGLESRWPRPGKARLNTQGRVCALVSRSVIE